MMFRIGLFLATNIAIMIVLSIAMQVFGLTAFTEGYGINYTGLLAICAIMGFTGSFLSLVLSKWIALRSVGGVVIKNPGRQDERWLIDQVHELSARAGIGMPDVAIYDSPDVNAFATGMSKNKALVAVSTGLMRSMSPGEIKAVLAHEVSHIANGDMVTLTLIQGVVNTFVMFAARIVGHTVDKVLLGNRDGVGIGYYLSVLVCEIVFGILASIIVMWFSRRREFRADAGAAALHSRFDMIAALKRLQAVSDTSAAAQPKEIAALAISSGPKSGLLKLFMSHPPLSERIRALEDAAKVVA